MMSNKNRRFRNPDFRHNSSTPLPQIEKIEKKLKELLSPNVFISLHKVKGVRLRDRILTLPVVVAIVMTMVYRRLPSLCEAIRVIGKEKLLWLKKPVKVTQQALSARLRTLPASLFANLLRLVIIQLNKEKTNNKTILHKEEKWQNVIKGFSVVWIADGSTLEALKKT